MDPTSWYLTEMKDQLMAKNLSHFYYDAETFHFVYPVEIKNEQL